MADVLVIGATGYVGRRLVPRLLKNGHTVRCLVRNPSKAPDDIWKGAEIAKGDVFKPETLKSAMKNIKVVYYLVHSMTSSEKNFEELDREAAANAAGAAKQAGVERIIYLGGLGRRYEGQSRHLRSRHEVGEILRASGIPVTEFRAAVLIGTGSFSFEMIHHLVNRLPVMICPRWVLIKTQPIDIDDALRYLVDCLDKPESVGRILDIGGPDVLTYYDMMMTVAKVLDLKRYIIRVPVLTPRLSSYWLRLVTPVSVKLGRSIIESLKSETVCENDDARRIFGFEPIGFEEAVKKALIATFGKQAKTVFYEAISAAHPFIDPSHLRVDRRVLDTEIEPEKLFEHVQKIGGDNGYYYAYWLWRLRGFIDRIMGGIGLRKGRRDPYEIAEGDAIDFWRVEEFTPGKRLLLRAEMKLWGLGWLEFIVETKGNRGSRLIQTVRYYPKGLWGIVYWYMTYPIHILIFRNMARNLVESARKQKGAKPEGSAPFKYR